MNTTPNILKQPIRSLRIFTSDDPNTLLPKLSVGANGTLQMTEGFDVIRQSLMTLLSTRPGERVMRPTYGCDLEALAFAGHGSTTEMLASLMIRRAIERFEPRVEVIQVEAQSDADTASQLLIRIDYKVRHQQQQDHLAFVVPILPEEETQ
ncbi:type VI secretion system baseplate subunit TssE [Parasulfitobacter algicola]|uniref:Type VI secretion system baseplate subunit TssE n=1 Tax=Parasulfitobacter algicola TaxID=2614809 RepID=A0ABX2IT80_9RHOB|nr:type VI secretion system baseplate subunit TssE [Sulfitobacter algicola]NSX55755.1 type VI secretion system baseplate subunit TssE [Sulfitobacter algicola]